MTLASCELLSTLRLCTRVTNRELSQRLTALETIARVYSSSVTEAYKAFYLVPKSTEKCCNIHVPRGEGVLGRPQRKTQSISRATLHSRLVLCGAVLGGEAASHNQLPDDRAPKALTYRCGIHSTGITGLAPFICAQCEHYGLRDCGCVCMCVTGVGDHVY